MSDLISREALLKKECCGRVSGDDVRNAPAVEAEPVRPARYNKSGECTECGCAMPTDDKDDVIHPHEINYCYKCGAKIHRGEK